MGIRFRKWIVAIALGLFAIVDVTAAAHAAPTPGPRTPASPKAAWPAGDRVTVASGLNLPWGLVQLSDESILVTQSDSGEVIRFAPGVRTVVGRFAGVDPSGEGGLLGLLQDPGDARVMYAYLSTATDNRVVKAAWDPATQRLTEGTPILTGIPHGTIHNGGRLAFGPDGYLYVTTGEAGQTALAQDRNSLGGKILRITRTGAAAPGNPFGTRIWSWGHRNVQGIDWDARGVMWASELGLNTWDELNRIEPGKNYGWPVVEGPANDSRFTNPVRWWAPPEMSPSGIEIVGDKLYIAALRGRSMWEVPLNGGTARRLLNGDPLGRLRTLQLARDGRMFVVTGNGSNTDKVELINLAIFDSAITKKYQAMGGAASRLGKPVGGEYCGIRDGGCYQDFEGGAILWSPATGAHFNVGAIRAKYASLGYESSRLGYPTTDEVCGIKDVGCYQNFQGGAIVWSPATGAHPSWGAVRDRWQQLGFENGRLGYPIRDERCGLRDGGCFQEFQGGAIYWSPASGAHPVYGLIRQRWADTGWERGPYRYPIEQEACSYGTTNVCRQRFQGGVIEVRW